MLPNNPNTNPYQSGPGLKQNPAPQFPLVSHDAESLDDILKELIDHSLSTSPAIPDPTIEDESGNRFMPEASHDALNANPTLAVRRSAEGRGEYFPTDLHYDESPSAEVDTKQAPSSLQVEDTLPAEGTKKQKTAGKDSVKPKCSKAYVVAQLPSDYRDAMAQMAHDTYFSQPDSNRGNFYTALLLAIATGLRPEELHQGLSNPDETLNFGIEDGRLYVQIFCAKVAIEDDGKRVRGLDMRLIYLNPDFCLASRYLFEFAQAGGQKNYCWTYNKDTLRKQTNRLGDRYIKSLGKPGLLKLSISPYCFRHSLASDLKSAEGVSATEIAQFLGHWSLESCAHYGRKRPGAKSPVKPFLSVESKPEPNTAKPPKARPFKNQAVKPGQGPKL